MIICIDPGHGGPDFGAVGPTGLKESDVNLSIGLKLRNKLQLLGITVIMTREGDISLGNNTNNDLTNRVKIANDNNADYFISIHCNSAVDASANGTETYCYKFGGNGEKLARAIQSSLIQEIGLKDRGVKTANFAVLKNTVMPAVLVENAFISNQSEEALLKDDNKREQFAEAIAKGICNHLGIKYEFNSNNHWAQKYYDYLISKGISIHETRFDDPITRGEVFVLLAKVMGYKG